MMPEWSVYYASRKVSAAEAVQLIKPGSRVITSSACGEPQTLVEGLAAAKDHISGVTMYNVSIGSSCPYLGETSPDNLRLHSLFFNPAARKLFSSPQVDYLPIHYSDVSRWLTAGILKVDVALIQVSSPDRFGYCSLGISVDYAKAAVDRASLVLAEVNSRMPRTLGDTFVHVTEIDYFVESCRELLEIPSAPVGETERRIGEYVAELVPNGATFQTGTGAVPEAVLQSLHGKQDLGVHSGMLCDGLVDLVQAGVITNRLKPIDQGAMVATILLGTRKLYDFADDNPAVRLYPSTYTHDVGVCGSIPGFISINSALQVDLSGQVNAEEIGGKHLTGAGGLTDFVRGANRSTGGKAIIALPATAGSGQYSRIVPHLTGGVVSCLRSDIHYIVTEYGVATLQGKTLQERARELLAIADPRFRPELEKALR